MNNDNVEVKLCTNGNNIDSTKFLRPLVMMLENQEDEKVITEIDGIKNITSIDRGGLYNIIPST